MADLYIDGAMLARVKGNFSRIEDLLNGPARKMKAVEGSQMGPSALVGRVNEFGDEWSYGIEQLGEFSGSVVDALRAIEDAFDEAETNLAQALEQAGDGV